MEDQRMCNFNLICRFFLAILLLSFPGMAEAQKKEVQKEDQFLIVEHYPLISIDAQVMSRSTGLVVSDLTHKDFVMSENNSQQTIYFWQRLPMPLSLLILVDTVTGPNRHLIDNQLKALKSSLASYLKPEDKVSIMVMAENPIV